jgi:DNA relaxase NicK
MFDFSDLIALAAASRPAASRPAGGGGFGTAVVSNTPPNWTSGRCGNIKVGIDWVQGTFGIVHLHDCIEFLGGILGDTFALKVDAEGNFIGIRWYRFVYAGASGAVIACGYRRRDRFEHCYLQLSASVLALLSPSQILELIAFLHSIGFKPSRLDIRLDDYEKRLKPQDARECADNGQVFGFKSGPTGRCYSYVCGRDGGDTIYFGSRGKDGSGKLLRIYDKAIESKGVVDAIRIEVELSSKKARDFWELLVTADMQSAPAILLGAIAASIRFAQCRDNSRRADRSDNLPVWDELVGDAATVVWSPCVKQDSLQKSIDWLKRQVSATFASVLEAISRIHGDTDACLRFFYELWAEGEDKITGDFDKQLLIEQYVKFWGGDASCGNLAPEMEDEFIPTDEYIDAVARTLPGPYYNPTHYGKQC